ncbi:VUT family protein [Castellaniella sp.]|uniref:VUT family protein n=1 Tax=Castellaniella sp. TaxID=1955812 RepID=UPI00355CC799
MSHFHAMSLRQFAIAFACMVAIVVGSNILVQYPINPWLTWGAITYPVSFLVTDVLNRRFGPRAARRVVYGGFVAALVVSIWLASPRIALASGSAFLIAQLTDITIFNRLRHQRWWRAPFIGGAIAAVFDTVAFFAIAFAGTDVPWPTLLVGDLAVKLLVNLLMLAPFRALMWNLARPAA